jgi:hypothetical protein
MKLRDFFSDTAMPIAELARRAKVSDTTIKNAIEGKNLTLENAYKIHLATKGRCTLIELLPEEVLRELNLPQADSSQGANDA